MTRTTDLIRWIVLRGDLPPDVQEDLIEDAVRIGTERGRFGVLREIIGLMPLVAGSRRGKPHSAAEVIRRGLALGAGIEVFLLTLLVAAHWGERVAGGTGKTIQPGVFSVVGLSGLVVIGAAAALWGTRWSGPTRRQIGTLAFVVGAAAGIGVVDASIADAVFAASWYVGPFICLALTLLDARFSVAASLILLSRFLASDSVSVVALPSIASSGDSLVVPLARLSAMAAGVVFAVAIARRQLRVGAQI